MATHERATTECPSAERLAAVASGVRDIAVSVHAELCGSCRAALVDLVRERAPAGTEPAALGAGSVVDRFVIESRLGAGGMGVVYAARDPKLQRTIALKVLRPAIAATGLARLEREAQAAAAVAHPNVVAIYDVGSCDGRVFVAMEHIRGPTLRAWSATSRSWRDVVARLIEAGRGIAAVHAAGLVHRDVKPDNILIGEDGRARVSDFGLARAAEYPVQSERPDDRAPMRTGSLVGTPAYAAPEQLAGGAVSELADQYAFAVTAWEALYGARPFDAPASPHPATSASTTGDAVWSNELRAREREVPRPPRRRGPAAIERALRRALHNDPAARHESMAALVSALERAVASPRRWLIGGAIAIATTAAALTVAAAVRTGDTGAQPCRGLDGPLVGAWDPAAKVELAKHFAASGHPAAIHRYTAVTTELDRYALAWANARTAVCEATRVRGEASEQQLAVAMACLDDRLVALRGLADELSHGDAAIVDRAADGARLLPAIARCHGTQVDSGSPAALAIRRELERIPQILMLHGAGAATQLVDGARSRAAAVADPGLDAELRFAAARVALANGDSAHSRDELRAALASAERARDDRMRAQVAIVLVEVARELSAFDEAARMVELADAVVARIGGGRELADTLAGARGRLAIARGQAAEGLGWIDQALASSERADPESLQTASLLYDRHGALRALNRDREAAAAWRRASAIVVAHYGDTDEGAALRLADRAHQALASGDPRRCVELAERVVAAIAIARDPNDADLHHVRTVLYAGYAMLGDWRRASDHMRDDVAVARATGRTADEAAALEHLGRAMLGLGDAAGAASSYRASATLAGELADPELELYARYGLGRALAVVGGSANAEAIDQLEWALPRLEAMTPPPANLIGMSHAGLADALWRRNGPGDRARALTAAQTARGELIRHRDQFAQTDPVGIWYRRAIEPEIANVEAWLGRRAK